MVVHYFSFKRHSISRHNFHVSPRCLLVHYSASPLALYNGLWLSGLNHLFLQKRPVSSRGTVLCTDFFPTQISLLFTIPDCFLIFFNLALYTVRFCKIFTATQFKTWRNFQPLSNFLIMIKIKSENSGGVPYCFLVMYSIRP